MIVDPYLTSFSIIALNKVSTKPAAAHWSMDFVNDQLFDGRPVRVLTVVDQFTRLSPIVEPRFSFKGCDVASALDRVTAPGPSAAVDHGRPWPGVHLLGPRGLGVAPSR